MSLNKASANYNGRVPTNTAFVKTFIGGSMPNYWTKTLYNSINVITPVPSGVDVYIQGNLYLGGNFNTVSDVRLKEQITDIPETTIDDMMKIDTKQFIYKNDKKKYLHYGFIAQEVEKVLPSLVLDIPNKPNEPVYKSVNYIELVPLLLHKIQDLQRQIDELKEQNITK